MAAGETKFTPGPWKATGEEYLNQGYDIEAPEGWVLATAYYDEDMDEKSMRTAEANAQLIAASPTLLEALEEIAEARPDDPEEDNSPERHAAEMILLVYRLQEIARQAIRKVKGEEEETT